MSLKASNKGGPRQLIPSGTHVARCVRIVDIGTQYNPRYEKHEHKVLISWELPKVLIPEGQFAGEPFMMTNTYTLSLNERAALRAHLESWRGQAFTEEECDGFDITKLADKPCAMTVVHNVKGDTTYANIASISQLMNGVECPQRFNEILIYDLDAHNQVVFDKLPEWTQQKINASDERRGSPQSAAPTAAPAADDVPPPADEDEIIF